MNSLKRGLVVLVAGLFLTVISIGGAQAIVTGDNPKNPKSTKSDERGNTIKVPWGKGHYIGHKDKGEPKRPVKKDNQKPVIEHGLTD